MRSVPFRLDDAYGGLAEGRGLARLEGDVLVLEFQLKDSLFGAIKSQVKTLRLAPDDLESIRLRKGWFRRRLLVEARRLEALADLPGVDGTRVALKIARADADAAADLASTLTLHLSERVLRRLEEEARGDGT